MNQEPADSGRRRSRRSTAFSGAAMPVMLLGLSAAAASFGAAAAERPDFTGVWGVYRAPGESGFGFGGPQAELPLRPDARRRVEEYRALVEPTGDTPGGLCLGSGMPGS